MKRALLIGINEYPDAPLNGCVSDVNEMAEFLVTRYGFKENDIRLLVDARATTEAIVERIGWLLTGLRAGDNIVFHYSGHGAQIATRNPQGEIDGLDEIICPVDFDWTEDHLIRDKQFAKLFKNIPKGVSFTWVSDSCHSGDLTKALLPGRRIRNRAYPVPADLEWRLRSAAARNLKLGGMSRAAASINAAFISGCTSRQTSADAWFGDGYNGALTYYLLGVLEKNPGSPLVQVVKDVNKALKNNGFSQTPQLEGDAGQKTKPFAGIAHGTKGTGVKTLSARGLAATAAPAPKNTCTLTTCKKVAQVVIKTLELPGVANASGITRDTLFDDDLGADELTRRGWYVPVSGAVAACGCGPLTGMSPSKFGKYETVGEAIDAVCESLGIQC